MSFNASAKAHTGRQGDINPDVGKGAGGTKDYGWYEVKEDRIVFYDYSPDWLQQLVWSPSSDTFKKDVHNEMETPQTKKPHNSKL
jgi:hypothetical protein